MKQRLLLLFFLLIPVVASAQRTRQRVVKSQKTQKVMAKNDSTIYFAELARDYFEMYQHFKVQNQMDSATYYIELRAGLDTICVEYLRDAGDFFMDIDAYSQAEMYYQRGLSHSKRIFGERSDWCALFLQQIADICYIQNNYSESLKNYREAMAIYKQNHEEHDASVAKIMEKISTIYKDEAEDSALAKLKELYGDNHKSVISGLENMGDVYSARENFSKAKECYEQALAIRKDSLGLHHLTTTNSLFDMGEVCYRLNDYGRALDYLKQALEIRKEILGDNHFAVVGILNAIGNVYYGQKDYEKALDYYGQVLAFRENVYSDKHPAMVAVLNKVEVCSDTLSSRYYQQKQYDKAVSYYQQGLKVRRILFGEESSQVVASYTYLAYCNYCRKDYPQALFYYEKELAAFKRIYGENSKMVASAQESLDFIKKQMTPSDKKKKRKKKEK